MERRKEGDSFDCSGGLRLCLTAADTPELDQELARARAELAQGEAGLALAKTTAARWSELLKTASVSEQETAEKQADLALKSATVEGRPRERPAARRVEEFRQRRRAVCRHHHRAPDRCWPAYHRRQLQRTLPTRSDAHFARLRACATDAFAGC